MVATNLMEADFITFLRNATMIRRMGARALNGLVGNVNIPRQTGTTTPGWVAQAGAATESDSTFAVVALSPKTAHSMQDVTRDLLLQGTPAVEGLIRADLIDSMAVQLDFSALHGTGASNQPTGLAATAGIGAEAGGTNGAAPTWDNLVNLETLVANNNAAQGSVGYLTNTRVRGRLKTVSKVSGQNGFVWEDGMNGYQAEVTNAVPSNLVKGSSGAVCSAIIFGNFSDLIMGMWGGLELMVNPYTNAAQGGVIVHAFQDVDLAVRNAESFAAMLDALRT
jgi:HK97 family phage major capsid protein